MIGNMEDSTKRRQPLEPAQARNAVILIPVFNDWEAVALLLEKLALQVSPLGLATRVVLVDDASTAPAPSSADLARRAGSMTVEILPLTRNVGHQRAIALGMAFVVDQRPMDWLVVMDGDGEDDPADVPRLLAASRAEATPAVIFAERTKRSESALFIALYHLYRGLHRMLTGVPVRFGNFSVLPRCLAARLVTVSELWNHYAAAVVRSRLPYGTVPCRRSHRLAGRPKMNFTSLTMHGLSAISVFGDIIGVRMLLGVLVLLGLYVAGLGAGLGWFLAKGHGVDRAILFGAGLGLVLLLQLVFQAVIFMFIVLGGRQSNTFLPLRDYRHLIHPPAAGDSHV